MGAVKRFPDVKTARTVENLIYLIALMLEVPLFLAMYSALRSTNLAPALFGGVLGILGIGAMMVSSLPHVAHAAIFDLYQDPGLIPADQATFALLWQAIWGMINVESQKKAFIRCQKTRKLIEMCCHLFSMAYHHCLALAQSKMKIKEKEKALKKSQKKSTL